VNTIAVVLMPHGIGSQVLLNGVEVSHACRAIEIIAEVGEPTTVIVTLVGRVELMAEVPRVAIEHDPDR
jgi:hypothetical protein